MDVRTFHSPLSHFDPTSLIDSLAQPLMVLDGECCVVFANAAARRLLKASMRDLQGQPLDLLFADGPVVRGRLTRFLRAEAAEERRAVRLPVSDLDGRRHLSLKVTPLDDEISGPHLLVQLGRSRKANRRPALTLLPSLAAERAPDRHHLECA